jgi:pyruvate formate lyase activating enzyme
LHLLPFHQLGESKYEKMGVPYAYAGKKQLHEEDLDSFAATLREAGLLVQIGG